MDILKILFYTSKTIIVGVVCYVIYGLMVLSLWMTELISIGHIIAIPFFIVCIWFMAMILLKVLRTKYNRDNFNN